MSKENLKYAIGAFCGSFVGTFGYSLVSDQSFAPRELLRALFVSMFMTVFLLYWKKRTERNKPSAQ